MRNEEMLEKLRLAKAKLAGTSDASFVADAVDLLIEVVEGLVERPSGQTLSQAQRHTLMMITPIGGGKKWKP